MNSTKRLKEFKWPTVLFIGWRKVFTVFITEGYLIDPAFFLSFLQNQILKLLAYRTSHWQSQYCQLPVALGRIILLLYRSVLYPSAQIYDDQYIPPLHYGLCWLSTLGTQNCNGSTTNAVLNYFRNIKRITLLHLYGHC